MTKFVFICFLSCSLLAEGNLQSLAKKTKLKKDVDLNLPVKVLPTATPKIYVKCNSAATLMELRMVFNQFDEQLEIARQTPRYALSEQLTRLIEKKQAFETKSLAYPVCTKDLVDMLNKLMYNGTHGISRFLSAGSSNGDNTTQEYKARINLIDYETNKPKFLYELEAREIIEK